MREQRGMKYRKKCATYIVDTAEHYSTFCNKPISDLHTMIWPSSFQKLWMTENRWTELNQIRNLAWTPTYALPLMQNVTSANHRSTSIKLPITKHVLKWKINPHFMQKEIKRQIHKVTLNFTYNQKNLNFIIILWPTFSTHSGVVLWRLNFGYKNHCSWLLRKSKKCKHM